MTGRPQIVFLAGEAGIGKTRLLQHIHTMARQRGMIVCHSRGYESRSLPYLPFIDLLRQNLDQLPEANTYLLGSEVEFVQQFVDHGGIAPHADSHGSAEPSAQDQLRLFLILSRAMVKMACAYPTLYCFDDLQWTDSSSFELFTRLLYTVTDMAAQSDVPLYLIGAYRPEEADERLPRLLERLQREKLCQQIELSGLDEAQCHELLRSLGLGRPSQRMVAMLHTATQGNPLFIEEIFHDLYRRERLHEQNGYLDIVTPNLSLPQQVTNTIRSRLQGLSEASGSFLNFASVLGEQFSFSLLTLLNAFSEHENQQRLEEAIQQRLLVREDQTCAFAHPLIWHVCYDAIDPVRRQRLHRRIAAALEDLYRHDLPAHLLEIAHHVLAADALADPEQLVSYAKQAGDHAMTVYAWRDAARYYEAALAATDDAETLSPTDRADLHDQAGLARYRAQDAGPSLSHFTHAMQAFRDQGNIAGWASAAMEKARTQNTFAAVSLGDLIDLQPLEEALEALGESEPGLRGHIAAVMAESYRTARQTDKAINMAQHALEISDQIEDSSLRVYASMVLGIIETTRMRLAEAVQHWHNAITHARQADDPLLLGGALTRMSTTLTLLGRFDDVHMVAQELDALMATTHDWGSHSLVLSALTTVATVQGDFEAVERYAQQTLTLAHRSGYPWGGLRAVFKLALARALRGAWYEAEQALNQLSAPGSFFPDLGTHLPIFIEVLRQFIQSHAGNYDADIMAQRAAQLCELGGADAYALGPFCALLDTSAITESPMDAERAYAFLSSVAERDVLMSAGWASLLHRSLGVAATLNHRWDQAESHFQEAIATASRIGAKVELGRSHLDYTRLLIARSKGDDRVQALELARRAIVLFEELRMPPFIQYAERLLEVLQDGQRYDRDFENLGGQEYEGLLQLSRMTTNFLR